MQKNNDQCISTVEIDEFGEYFIVIPKFILMQLEWNAGDTLSWTVHEDKSVTLQKKDH